MYRYIPILLLFTLLTGCAVEVQPWQKEALASDAMREDDGNRLQRAFKEHIYFSKEGSRGGQGVGGGGCGCN